MPAVAHRDERPTEARPIETLCERGGAEGNQTPDLFIANEALYQLSYSPENPEKAAFVGCCSV